MKNTELRIYDKQNKKMLIFDPLEVCSDSDYYGGNDTWFADDDTEIEVPDIQKKDLYSDPMHPTGLKDKNDKEIWEGDIIKCEVDERIAEVSFKSGCFWYENNQGNYGELHNVLSDNLEVIGNIYENSELVEVKKCGQE